MIFYFHPLWEAIVDINLKKISKKKKSRVFTL